MFTQEINPKNQKVNLTLLDKKGIELWIKREDKIHEYVSGNKFRKLKYNISEAHIQQKKTILTFGGAFSNHIAATAVAGKLSNLKTIGIIRGEELASKLDSILKTNETLKTAHDNGMQFKFISRSDFRRKNEDEFIKQLHQEFGNSYIIPEGGTNNLAIKGCEEILSEEDKKFNYICTAVGTGGTISGLINSAKSHQNIIGFPALKGYFLTDEISKFTSQNNWKLQHDYNFGGYAKYNNELIRFINQFYTQTAIPLDPIYTGKMLFGIIDLIKNNYFKRGDKILAIHTGGLQGIKGFNNLLRSKNLEEIIQ